MIEESMSTAAKTQPGANASSAAPSPGTAERPAQLNSLDYRLLAEVIPQIVWTANPAGEVDYFNQRWCEYTGLSLAQTQGWGWEPVLHPDDLALCLEHWRQALQSGEIYEVEYRLKRAADGAYRWHLGRAMPVRDSHGVITQWVGTCTDIHDQKAAQAALQQGQIALERRVTERTHELSQANAALKAQIAEREQVEQARRVSEESYSRIIETANEGIWVLDVQLRITYVNHPLAAMLGYSAEAMLGRSLIDFLFEEDQAAMERLIARRRQGHKDRFEFRYRRVDNTELWARVSASPLLGKDGAFCGTMAMLMDITRERQTEATLRATKELYQNLVENASDLIYETDAAGCFTFFNHTALHLTKYPPEYLQGLHYLELVHPDSRKAAARFYGRQFIRKTVNSYYEYPMVAQDGSMVWFGQQVHLLLRDGQITGFQAVARDITGRKQAEAALRESEDRFKRLAEAAFEGMVITENGRVVDANSTFCQMLGYTMAQVIGSMATEFAAPEDRELVRCMIREGHEELYQIRCLRRDGTTFPAEIWGKAIPYQGRPARVAAIRDITGRRAAEQQIETQQRALEAANAQLRDANQQLATLATQDGLTGLKNHRAFQERLTLECHLATRHHTPLSLLLVDVDKFKTYNDSFGHPAGDAALKQVAQLLQRNTRDTDLVARYGGEEFAIILPQTPAPGAHQVAERIRCSIEKTAWPQRPITISGGLATLPLEPLSETQFVALADKALYQSKAAGRNRITITQ